ncbi:MAG: DUF1304 domain-containing protein [Amphiplicatus sp.]
MRLLAIIAVVLVAALHFGFLTLEMFFWDHTFGQKVFAMTAEQSANSAALAANQGLYNGFLAAGLLWGLIAKKRDVQIYFLLCVIVAGLFGGATAKPSIWFIQTLPGAIALALVLLAARKMLKQNIL